MNKCGTDFMHQEWGITSGQPIKVRCNIPKDKLTFLDRQYKDHQYPTTISYCNGCIEYMYLGEKKNMYRMQTGKCKH